MTNLEFKQLNETEPISPKFEKEFLRNHLKRDGFVIRPFAVMDRFQRSTNGWFPFGPFDLDGFVGSSRVRDALAEVKYKSLFLSCCNYRQGRVHHFDNHRKFFELAIECDPATLFPLWVEYEKQFDSDPFIKGLLSTNKLRDANGAIDLDLARRTYRDHIFDVTGK